MEPRGRQPRRQHPCCAQLVCQLPPRDVNRLAVGGRIQPRITIRVCATGATDPMWLPLLAATRCAHQLLHPLPLPTLPTCYCLNSAQRSRLSRCCRVAQPTDPGWPSLARLAADARMRCRLPGPSRQLRQADCLKPSFLLAPNRSADDQCQGCPQGITRDARSARDRSPKWARAGRTLWLPWHPYARI